MVLKKAIHESYNFKMEMKPQFSHYHKVDRLNFATDDVKLVQK